MKTLLSILVTLLVWFPSLQSQENKNYWSQDKVNEFVLEAQSKNLLMAAISKVSQEKSESQAVKDLARLEEQEHMKTEDRLEQAITVAIPVAMQPDDVDELDRLKEKTGKDLDREYLDALVRYHENALDNLERAKDNLGEASLRKWVTDQLPVAKEHLDRAKDLRNRIK